MITNKLEKWRSRHGSNGLSKAHVARKIGVSRSYITKLENGALQPSARIMFGLADYFGCRVEDIFKWVSDEEER